MNELLAEHGLSAATRPAVVRALIEDLAATAAARDAAGGTAKRERDLFRRSGLLSLTIPRDLGGAGGDYDEALTLARRIAAVDSSLAHLFAFHHLMLASLRFYGPREQWGPLFERTARESLFWGNALNPRDTRTRIDPGPRAGEFVVNGTKSFCSGASDSDMLFVSAHSDTDTKLVIAAVPTSRPGIRVNDDWNNMGQRQTDSGSVSFDGLVVYESEILRRPGPLGSIFAGLRSCLAQLILCNIYAGIAEGALSEASRYVSEQVRPRASSSTEPVADDPYVLRNFGEYLLQVRSASTLTDVAQKAFQAAFNLGDALEPATRAEVAIAIATAKVVGARAALEISSRMFEVLGARATDARLRFDRFWRNARTHTLHDPIDNKLQELGSWTLRGKPPTPGFYS
jgi:alkylation response protein AidB-like acyl-CoA dehydrogenase